MPVTNEQILDAVSDMTVNDLVALTRELEEKFGVKASDVQQFAPQVQQTPEVQEEEKTEFNVVLDTIGTERLKVIKAIRNLTGSTLLESRELLKEGTVLKKAVGKDEAEDAKTKLEEVGATVTLT